MVFTALLRRLETPALPHGFRTSFRNWIADCTERPRAVAEAALVHNVGSSTEAAYVQSDLFEQRRMLMDAWAKYTIGETDTEGSNRKVLCVEDGRRLFARQNSGNLESC